MALHFEGGALSHDVLNRRANRLARTLQARGVVRGQMVGVWVDSTPEEETFIGLLAILKAVGAYLPLDPGYPPERRAFMMEDARMWVLLARKDALPGGMSFLGDVVQLAAPGPLAARDAVDVTGGAGPTTWPMCSSLRAPRASQVLGQRLAAFVEAYEQEGLDGIRGVFWHDDDIIFMGTQANLHFVGWTQPELARPARHVASPTYLSRRARPPRHGAAEKTWELDEAMRLERAKFPRPHIFRDAIVG
ncbi:AMP-binding protein [Corallococcus sp. M7]